MAVSTIAFNGALETPTFTEGFCELTFTPPSNIAGKLCYVKSNGFTFSSDYNGRAGWNPLILSNNWTQPQSAHVDFNPNECDTIKFSADRTQGSKVLTNATNYSLVKVGMEIRGTVPGNTFVTDVTGTTVTLSNAITAATATTQPYFCVTPKSERQNPTAPLAVYNDFGQQKCTTLCYIPDGPHTVRFKVSRFDKGIIVSQLSSRIAGFSVIFNIVPANSRQPPIS